MNTLRISRLSLASAVFTAVLLLAYLGMFSQSVFAAISSPIMPTADGTYTQWTPSTGASHFALVDEAICNGTTDYNSTTGVGNRDSYAVSLASVPDGATITQISIKPCASRSGGGGAAPVLNVFYRANGADSSDSGAYSLSGTTPVELATTTYSGLSIVKSAATTLEVGAVLSSGSKGARLSRIATTITYTPLSAPSPAADVATTSSQIKVSWTDTSSNETGFSIERSTDANVWTAIASTTASSTAYYDIGLSANTGYYHRVRAFNSGGYSGYSNVANATTTDTVPSAPTGLTLSTQPGASSTTDVLLDWTDTSSNELGFKIERSVGTSTFTQIATTTANATSYIDASKSSGTYSYRLRSYNSGGNSAYSNSASTTIP